MHANTGLRIRIHNCCQTLEILHPYPRLTGRSQPILPEIDPVPIISVKERCSDGTSLEMMKLADHIDYYYYYYYYYYIRTDADFSHQHLWKDVKKFFVWLGLSSR
ncbi:hypothetical protein GOODEAATRI_031016 [Goodea atripinnis]|uniref:Uncharacterized protein n=1 Tax=Goodea atripinnis TaxID=208336 RepID=A0ABV0N8W5_9TELE